MELSKQKIFVFRFDMPNTESPTIKEFFFIQDFLDEETFEIYVPENELIRQFNTGITSQQVDVLDKFLLIMQSNTVRLYLL